ncbi:MAG: type sorting protein [Sphingobacteriales bacterium]|nr:type sorting protein [Sphingobacteriales bacterium]
MSEQVSVQSHLQVIFGNITRKQIVGLKKRALRVAKDHLPWGLVSGEKVISLQALDPLHVSTIYGNMILQKIHGQEKPISRGERAQAVGFSIGNKEYLGTGNDNSGIYKNDFWEYDPSADKWTRKADFPGSPRFASTGISINNKGYIGLGISKEIYELRDFYEYDPATNSWTRKADIPGLGRYFATGFSIGSKGYIGTGWTEEKGYLNDLWEYGSDTDTWTMKANLSGVPRQSAVGFSIGNSGYMGHGI